MKLYNILPKIPITRASCITPVGIVLSLGLLWISTGCVSNICPDIKSTTGMYHSEERVTGFSGDYPLFIDLDFLNYEELRVLSMDPKPNGTLGEKIDRFFNSALIDNHAWYNGSRPHIASTSKLGPMLRMGTWNIEKSIRIPELIEAIKSEAAYKKMIDLKKAPEGSPRESEMLRQRERLLTADILFLQEMDIGVNRSGYLDAAGELARTLKMNYAYAPQSLEVDPVLLGLEPVRNSQTDEIDVEATVFYKADPTQFKGAFGSAVLSRYPIKSVQVIPLKTVGYDWYEKEKKKLTFLEGARRFSTELVFKNRSTREIKIGGRHFFRVDVEVPGLSVNNTLTLINVHLEIKCKPEVRVQQIREILSYAADIPNPVIMAGDFNSSSFDLSPTSVPHEVHRTVTDPSALVPIAYEIFSNIGLVSFAHKCLNFLKNLHSPLAPNIPILFPNKVKPLIDEVKNFHFSDGMTFDFRGNKERSVGLYSGILSNSNQKNIKGHISTFQLDRPLGPLGVYRLDWIFVRSGFLVDPLQEDGSYQFAPHFGETLRSFNYCLKEPFSDHRPSMIDLPLGPPTLLVGD